jgi:phosphoglycerate dehydrogenase-like enzyme
MNMSDTLEVLVTLPFTDEMVARLQNISPRLHIKIMRTFRMEDISNEVWATVHILYTDRLLPSPEQAPNLRWIQFHWAGINHAVDAPILQQPGLLVTSLSGVVASKVAEHVVLMMLSLGLRQLEIFNAQRKLEWPADRWERFKPRELRGSTVGIVGYGSIGRQVARLLQPFEVKVLAAKRDGMQPEDRGYIPSGQGDPRGDLVWRLYPIEALCSMVKACDFVVVTLPLTNRTRNLISTAVFDAMKPSAYLIDVSRGGIIDHQALIEALKSHKLAGAALDVFPKEPLPPDNPLWKMPNVIISPHIAGVTHHYDERAVELFSENLRRYLAEEELLNRYDPDVGY